ncbi:MAG: glycosyltransferase family 39 protein [Candidatus Woesearchaeota archaeon]
MEKSRIILLIVVALFIFSALPFVLRHSIFWDEAVYIGIGKSIWSLGSSGIWEPIRPLGLPLLIGIFWKIGLPVIVSSQILSLIFSASAIILSYFVAEALFNKFVAVISAVILAVTPLFLFHSPEIMTEVPSTVFAIAAVLFFIKKKYAFAGAFAGVAFLFKFPLALVVVALALSLLFQQVATKKLRLKHFLQLILPFIAAVLPYFLLNAALYRENEILNAAFGPLLSASSHQYNPVHAVSGIAGNIFYYPAMFLMQNPLLAFSIAGLFFIVRKDFASRAVLALAPFTLFCYFALIINKQLRFGLAFLPFVAILSAYGIHCLLSSRKSPAVAMVILVIVGVTASLSAVAVMKTSLAYYSQLQQPNPELYEFYSYFSGRDEVQILTTTPIPTAFSDQKFIPMYDNPAEALRVYGNYSESASAAVYTSNFFPCEYYGAECEAEKQKLFASISKNRILKNLSNNYLIVSLS